MKLEGTVPEVVVTDHQANIPVFLPSSSGERLVIGEAIITAGGEIAILLDDEDMPDVIREMVSENQLRGVTFDYYGARSKTDIFINRRKKDEQ